MPLDCRCRDAWSHHQRRLTWIAALVLILLAGRVPSWPLLLAQQRAASSVDFTAAQATQGEADYRQHCASCHGQDLEGNQMAVPLRGAPFVQRWGGQTAANLFDAISRMPPSNRGGLGLPAYARIEAFLLSQNGLTPGSRELPVDSSLGRFVIAFDGTTRTVSNRPRPESTGPLVRGPSRLDQLTAVTPAMLGAPRDADWLLWRRTYDGHGFSPLKQIDKGNVSNLHLAWSWSLPPGSNEMVPLVHDGVIFAYSFGDVVEAIDAANGELLWRYQHQLQSADATYHAKKGIAIIQDRLIVPTSDKHLVALEMKTGRVVWDHTIDIGGEISFLMKNGPLIVKDKAIIGLAGYGAVERGSFIVAVDVNTGKEVWRFNTVARPGEPGGETWNDLPLDSRSGGSVWNPGSYDPDLNLVYFGTAPTYDTMPLRKPIGKPGVSNDALYTDATIALNPDTGKLVWYFQHQKNDQLDHDWAFERVLTTLPVNGAMRKVVVTGGKQAIFEAVDAATGAYLFSIDLGMQNIISAIDPKTGAKTINPETIPPPGNRAISLPGACPDTLGARNWMATAYDASRHALFIPMTDTCVDSRTKTRWQKNPDPATDGQWGLMKAIDLETRQVAWTRRERGPSVGAAVATAGGVVFYGTGDRWFHAYDSAAGTELWRMRLNNIPSSFPVTFLVDGRQYVAVATSDGTIQSNAVNRTAGLNNPMGGATLWVFSVDERRTR